jgi:protein translocase SecG subunit
LTFNPLLATIAGSNLAKQVDKTLIIIQVLIGALLTGAVLMQSKGATLGEAFGGSGVFYGARRGTEKTLFIITIVLAIIFVGLAYLMIFI